MPTPKKIAVQATSQAFARERDRAACYLRLARCFHHPSHPTFRHNLRGPGWPPSSRLGEAAAAQIARWRQAAHHPDPKELIAEYNRLFATPGAALAPPLASRYLAKAAAAAGKRRAAVAGIYEQLGLLLAAPAQQPPDHIAVELEFVHYLITLRLDALAAGDEQVAAAVFPTEQLFLAEQLHPWLGPFCQELRRQASHEFYRATARCLELLSNNAPTPLGWE